MKISREARDQARAYFRLCFSDNALDEGKFRALLKILAEHKPRHVLSILQRLKRLARLEIERRTFVVDSATELPDQGKAIFERLESRFGKPLATSYNTRPELVGGLRIRVGSDVWDGSVLQRLNSLQTNLR